MTSVWEGLRGNFPKINPDGVLIVSPSTLLKCKTKLLECPVKTLVCIFSHAIIDYFYCLYLLGIAIDSLSFVEPECCRYLYFYSAVFFLEQVTGPFILITDKSECGTCRDSSVVWPLEKVKKKSVHAKLAAGTVSILALRKPC